MKLHLAFCDALVILSTIFSLLNIQTGRAKLGNELSATWCFLFWICLALYRFMVTGTCLHNTSNLLLKIFHDNVRHLFSFRLFKVAVKFMQHSILFYIFSTSFFFSFFFWFLLTLFVKCFISKLPLVSNLYK